MKNRVKTNSIVLYNLLIVVFLFTSCERNDTHLKIENLKGTWLLAPNNYIFISDSLESASHPIDLFSFLSIDDSSKYSYYDVERTDCEYYFNLVESKYKIQKDTLSIFHKRNKEWYKFKLISLNQDTLNILNLNWNLFHGLDTVQFIREQKNYTNNPLDFDEIIIEKSRTMCNGTAYVLDKNGTLQVFESREDNKGLSETTYKISTKLTDSLFNNFKYLNFKKVSLKNHSTINSEELLKFNIYFVKGGQVIKTIEDYYISTPIEFSISYLSIIGLDLKELHRIPNKSNSETKNLVKQVFKHEWR